MPLKKLVFLAPLLAPLLAIAAQLPQLRTEPTGGGSFFTVKNVSTEPLTGYLIELVGYPGSYYALWQDEAAGQPIPPGGSKRMRVANMTVGAVPDYVKIQAAIFADGTTAGVPLKVMQFIDRRRFVLKTTRDLIARLEKGETKADLEKWSASLEPEGKVKPTAQPVINQAAARALIAETVSYLDGHSSAQTLAHLRESEKALAASKPAL